MSRIQVSYNIPPIHSRVSSKTLKALQIVRWQKQCIFASPPEKQKNKLT